MGADNAGFIIPLDVRVCVLYKVHSFIKHLVHDNSTAPSGMPARLRSLLA